MGHCRSGDPGTMDLWPWEEACMKGRRRSEGGRYSTTDPQQGDTLLMLFRGHLPKAFCKLHLWSTVEDRMTGLRRSWMSGRAGLVHLQMSCKYQ